jgi:cell division protein FtsB
MGLIIGGFVVTVVLVVLLAIGQLRMGDLERQIQSERRIRAQEAIALEAAIKKLQGDNASIRKLLRDGKLEDRLFSQAGQITEMNAALDHITDGFGEMAELWNRLASE